MTKTILIFIDGVGIGNEDYSSNPFFKYNFSIFNQFFKSIPTLTNQTGGANGAYFFPVDALMGVDGLPQSGTGQTSIFCGINAQKAIGQHFGPFPHSELIPYLEKENIFKTFLERGKKVSFVNAYPKLFFDYIKSGKKRLSVTTLCCNLSGVKLFKAADLHKGCALSAEIDNYRWVNKLNYKMPIIQPETAAKRLFKIAGQNDLTVFEYFLTDHIGHGRILDTVERTFTVLDKFLYFILTNLPENISLIICSDHGNVENMAVKGHTLNPALAITAGKNAEKIATRIKNLADIKHAIMEGNL